MDNPFQRYQNKRYLIVDDFSEFRHSLKKMLESFGANDIDLAADAEQAIALYAEHRHQVILADYNLGEQLTGLQLLEELYFRELFQASTLFVLLTGETALELVAGALQYRPDDLLAKPFTKSTLKARLDRLLSHYDALAPLFSAINQGKIRTALQKADDLSREYPRLALQCHKLTLQLLLNSGQFALAQKMAQQLLEQRELLWVKLVLAKASLALNDIANAQEQCLQIIAQNKFALDAYDILTEIYKMMGLFEKAFDMAKQASELSPCSLVRQRNLGHLALMYQEALLAKTAMQKVIELGKFSVAAEPDDYVYYARALHLLAKQANNQGRRAISDLGTVLKFSAAKFSHDIQFRLALQLHQWLVNSPRYDDPDLQIQPLLDAIAQLPDELRPLLVSQLDWVKQQTNHDASQALINDLEARLGLLKQSDDAELAAKYNRQGMIKFRQGQFQDAFAAFKSALLHTPDNNNIALNLLQSLHKVAKSQGVKDQHLELLTLCEQAQKSLAPQDPRREHSQALLRALRASYAQHKAIGG